MGNLITINYKIGGEDVIDIADFVYALRHPAGGSIALHKQKEQNYGNQKQVKVEINQTLEEIVSASCKTWHIVTQSSGVGLRRSHLIDGRKMAINLMEVSQLIEGQGETIIFLKEGQRRYYVKEPFFLLKEKLADCDLSMDDILGILPGISGTPVVLYYNEFTGESIDLKNLPDTFGNTFNGIMPDTIDGINIEVNGQGYYSTDPGNPQPYDIDNDILIFNPVILEPYNLKVKIYPKVFA